jgi:hypothetical protein
MSGLVYAADGTLGGPLPLPPSRLRGERHCGDGRLQQLGADRRAA